MTLSEFIHMNGYGFYVWSSFGMTALLMLGELLLVKSQNRTILARVRRITRLHSKEEPNS